MKNIIFLLPSLFLKIDHDRFYKNYLDQYVKVPNSPHLPLWEIFTEYFIKSGIQKIH